MTPLCPTPDFIEFLMGEALREAEKGSQRGEVPVGAVLAIDDTIISRAHNLTESLLSPIAHAEVLAIQAAATQQQNWRLDRAILCVTLEPCTMCTGSILLARIPLVILGAHDSKQGAMGSLYDLSTDPRHAHSIRTIRNVRSTECSKLLRDFFTAKR